MKNEIGVIEMYLGIQGAMGFLAGIVALFATHGLLTREQYHHIELITVLSLGLLGVIRAIKNSRVEKI